jgi:hypothetical protein
MISEIISHWKKPLNIHLLASKNSIFTVLATLLLIFDPIWYFKLPISCRIGSICSDLVRFGPVLVRFGPFSSDLVIRHTAYICIRPSKNMYVYGHPTDPFFQPPTLTFFIGNYSTLIFVRDPINFYTEFG